MRPIDADALLEQIGIDSDGSPGYYGDTWQFIKTIENAPTLDMTSEWIPCEERLPSEQGHYLVTFPLCNGDPWACVLSFCNGKFYETDDEWGDVEYDDVTAWMPLPKPYTADRKTEPQMERSEK